MMTFEGTAIQGAAPIIEKLVSLPFQKIKHAVSTQDAQPSGEHGGILVMITGALLVWYFPNMRRTRPATNDGL